MWQTKHSEYIISNNFWIKNQQIKYAENCLDKCFKIGCFTYQSEYKFHLTNGQ